MQRDRVTGCLSTEKAVIQVHAYSPCNTFHPRSLNHGRSVRGYIVGERKDRGHNQRHMPFDNNNLYEVFVVNY